MSILMEIQEDVNEIANAIASALKVDVEIVDADLIRVAVIGKLEYMKGKKLFTYGHNYRKSFKTGEKYIVNSPGQSELCRKCEWYGKCIYKMAIYAPIKGENEVIGIISLTAFNDEQHDILINNLDANLYFADKMANLIYSKVKEKRMLKNMIVVTNQLNQVMNYVDRGIVATDNTGRITHTNNLGMEMLKLSDRETILSKPIEKIFPSLQYRDFISLDNQDVKKLEICTSAFSNQDKYIVNVRKIFFKDEVAGMVISFENYNSAKNTAYNLVSGDRPIGLDDIIGQSKSMMEVKNKVLRVSHSNSTIMLIGETGTGKELFARAIHYHSKRCDKPFVTVNCSAIPDSLIESELFGYEKGAFTGANKLGKPGKFEMANGGAVFLDEIEAMPIYMQPKILRVLQEKEVVRVGSNEIIPIDVRIISATNADLENAVAKGQFRADLYHRLNVVPIVIPPLRERKDDILLIANYFTDKFSKAMAVDIKGFDKEVEKLFLSYAWPGNIRELKNAIEFAVNLEDSQYITKRNLPMSIKNFTQNAQKNHIETLKEIEKKCINEALNKYGWDENGRIMAANKLGISRSTIYRKIKSLKLKTN